MTTRRQARQNLNKEKCEENKKVNGEFEVDTGSIGSPLHTTGPPKQGPIGIHQIFPYPELDLVDEERIDSPLDPSKSNTHKRRKVLEMEVPPLPPDCLDQIQEDLVKFDGSQWRERQLKDDYFAPIMKYLESEELPAKPHRKAKQIVLDSHQFFLYEGVLYRSCKSKFEGESETTYQLCIPKDLQYTFVKLAHEDPMASSHQNPVTAYLNFKRKYFFPKMLRMIEEYATSCHECQTKKNYGSKPRFPINIEDQRPYDPNYHSVTIDLVGPFVPAIPLIDKLKQERNKELIRKGVTVAPFVPRKFKYLLTIIQEATRFVVAVPLQDVTAPTVALEFLEQYILKYGPPQNVHSDRGTVFLSGVFKYICKALQSTRSISASFNPTSSAKVERCHKTIVSRLSASVGSDSRNWATFLPYVLYAYNSSIHGTLGYSPFNLLFGRQPQFNFELNLPSVPEPTLKTFPHMIKAFFEGMQRIRYIAANNMERIMRKYVQRHNTKAKNITFEVSDLVYLKCAPREHMPKEDQDVGQGVKQVKERVSLKLAPKYFGPLRIIHKLPSSDIYKLMDIYTSRILPNYFHGRLLKLAHLRPHYPLDIGYDLPESIVVKDDVIDVSPSVILHRQDKEANKVTRDNEGKYDELRGLMTPPNTPPACD